jgi:DnaJ-class molecular chaperone
VSRAEAFTIFGLNGEQLASMRKKDLTRMYRQKAHELHPDKGGDTEQFIRLTLAYEELLPSLP